MTHACNDLAAEQSIVPAIVGSAPYRAAVRHLWESHDRFINDLVTLTQIAAPPFLEAARGRAYRRLLEAAGLDAVSVDAIGNVSAIRRGTASGSRMVAVSAHLDTVFPESTDVTVRREGDLLFAPGIGDNTRGLATILAYLRALDAAGIRTHDDILVLATVGEEGEGDLRGMRHFFAEDPRRDRIKAMLCLDGPTRLASIVSAGTGSKRYRATFRGPGGHSFADHGVVNPLTAAARAIVELDSLILPSEPKTTCNATVIRGGSSINAIPDEVSILVDLRSNNAAELARLDARFHDILHAASRAENGTNSVEKGEITLEIEIVGNRPAGATAPGELVDFAAAAIRQAGQTPVFETFSTDANIAMSLGIPAVTLSFGGEGGGAHTLGEWTDVTREASIRGMAVGLTVLLASAGGDFFSNN